MSSTMDMNDLVLGRGIRRRNAKTDNYNVSGLLVFYPQKKFFFCGEHVDSVLVAVQVC